MKGEHDPVKGTQGELIQKFKAAHDTLWGGGALAPTTAFDELDKLIFCKIWDESWEDNDPRTRGEPYQFQLIYYPEDPKNLKAKTELENRVRALYEEGRKKDSEVFKEDIKLDKHKIFTVVQYLQDINLSATELDAKGLAFQSFMGEFFRGDFGQFFTPDAIVQIIVKAIGVKKDYKVLDTSCGSGGFLLHALRAIREEADELYSEKSAKWFNYWHDFAEKRLFGIEINEQISRVAKMNMIIHDDGHTNIITNDGLKNSRIETENRNLHFQDGTFDLIMTNPPFGSTIKADEVSYYKEYELFERHTGITELKERIADDNNKNKWRPSQSTEILFMERCHRYLSEGGYLAIVIPDGILTNATSQYVRDWITEKFRIIAVVSLPQHTFAHVKVGVKSSILFLKKHPQALTRQLENILSDIKDTVRDTKGLDKEAQEERVLELYNILIEYIHFLLRDKRVLESAKNSFGGSAGQQRVSSGYLKSIQIPLPPITVQQQIVDLYNAAIEEKQAKEKEAKELLAGVDDYLLKELGIELPENADNERFFEVNIFEILGGQLDVKSARFKTYKRKSIKFDEIALSGIASINKGKSITKEKIIAGKYTVIAGGQTSPYAHSEYNEAENAITVSASGAYSGYVWFHDYKIFASDCSVVRSKDETQYMTEYIYSILKLKQDELYRMKKGAGQPHVYPNDIASVTIPIVPFDKQQEIATYIRSTRTKAKQLKDEAVNVLEKAKREVEGIVTGRPSNGVVG